ncbi:hypothetical protein V8E54_012969 [Elaphomyces granulatus]
MGKGTARRRAAAQKTRKLLTKGNESVLLSELEGFAEAIAGAYDGLRQYQEGQVPGQKGVILDYDTLKTYDRDEEGKNRAQNPLTIHVYAFGTMYQQVIQIFRGLLKFLRNIKENFPKINSLKKYWTLRYKDISIL